MKLLMSNSRDKTLLAPQYAKSLRNMDIEVFDYFQSDYSLTFNLFDKILHKIYPNFFYKKINDQLLSTVSKVKPDVLLIFKGMETFPETLLKFKDQGIKLVNYNPDHPFDYFSSGSGNRNVLDSIPLYDLHICYSHKIAKDMRKKFPNAKTSILPFGYALSDSDFNKIKSVDEVNKICFIGFADKERADFISMLTDLGFKIDVYGSNWEQYFSNSDHLVTIFKGVSGLDYYRILRKYRVQLNILRPHNEDSHNMRSFEVPAAGGILLAPDTLEHVMFFENEKEAFLYKTQNDMVDYLNYILSLSSAEANSIRINARERSVQSKYDYPSRAIELYNILKNI